MNLPESLVQHVTPFMLVLARMAGLFVMAPVIASPMIPVRIRALLALMFSLAVYPTIHPLMQAPLRLDVLSLGLAAVGESLVGVAIGLLALIPTTCVQLGGLLVDQQVGLGLAGLFNPALDSEGTVMGELLVLIALSVFLVIGGLDHLFLALVRTFERVPLGATVPAGVSVTMIVGVLSSGFDLALRIALPVLCIIFLETVASALVMKTMPQVNIMSIGFGVKVLAGLLTLTAAIFAIEHTATEEISAVCRRILDWSLSL